MPIPPLAIMPNKRNFIVAYIYLQLFAYILLSKQRLRHRYSGVLLGRRGGQVVLSGVIKGALLCVCSGMLTAAFTAVIMATGGEGSANYTGEGLQAKGTGSCTMENIPALWRTTTSPKWFYFVLSCSLLSPWHHLLFDSCTSLRLTQIPFTLMYFTNTKPDYYSVANNLGYLWRVTTPTKSW